MKSCEFVSFISLLACQIAKDKTQEEISCLGAFLHNFGDTLITISSCSLNDK